MKKSCSGFTLIELLVAMSIVGILFTIGMAKYQEFNRRQVLVQAAQELKNNLRLAQDKALAGEKPSSGCTTLAGYSMSFFSGTPDYYEIQAQCNPEGPAGTPRTFYLVSSVDFDAPLPSPILFKVLAQGTDLDSDLTISLTSFGETHTVTVTKTGEIR